MELLAQERDERSMAINLVSSALEYPRLSLAGSCISTRARSCVPRKGFRVRLSRSDVQHAYELHQRYGNEVGRVIDDAIRQHAVEIREHRLLRDCLLRALIEEDQMTVDRTPLWAAFPGESSSSAQVVTDARDFRRTSRIQLALDRDRERVRIEGLGVVGTMAQFEIVSILVRQHKADFEAGLRLENRASVPNKQLMDELDMDSEPALIRRISDFRENLSKLALERWGIQLSRNAVIETDLAEATD